MFEVEVTTWRKILVADQVEAELEGKRGADWSYPRPTICCTLTLPQAHPDRRHAQRDSHGQQDGKNSPSKEQLATLKRVVVGASVHLPRRSPHGFLAALARSASKSEEGVEEG